MHYLIFLPLILFFAVQGYCHWQRCHRLTVRLRTLGMRTEKPQYGNRIALLARPLASTKERRRIGLRLNSAGLRAPVTIDKFLLIKLSIFLATLLTVVLLADINLQAPLISGKWLLLLFVATRIPDWWLNEHIRTRQRRIRTNVPQMIDLLTICADAGLSLEEALSRVATEIAIYAPEIASELRQTASELMIMPDRTAALARLGSRSDVEDLARLAKVLMQSLRFGTPLAQAMRAIATDCRARELATLEEKAGKLAANIGVPLIVLVLFPLVALMTAPAVINLLRTLDKVGK